MLLKDFEDTLKNIENDRMLMSFGNNQETINNILSIVNIVKSAQNLIKIDRTPDMFSMSVSSKLMELENLIVTLGYQRLMERGINVQPGGMRPMVPNMPIYNQPMPQFMQQTPPQMHQHYGGGYQQQYAQQPQQQQSQQQQQAPPQMHQPSVAAPQQPAPTMPVQPEPAAAPVQQPSAPAPKAASAPSSSSAASVMAGGLPGMSGGGSDEKAAGRDFLLQLLSEKS